jgi:hypothetical protein
MNVDRAKTQFTRVFALFLSTRLFDAYKEKDFSSQKRKNTTEILELCLKQATSHNTVFTKLVNMEVV